MLNKELLLNSSQGVKLTVLQKPSGNASEAVTHVLVYVSGKLFVSEQLEVGVPFVCYTPAELVSVAVTKDSTRYSFFYTETENLAPSPVSGELFFYGIDRLKPKYLAFCCSTLAGGGTN